MSLASINIKFTTNLSEFSTQIQNQSRQIKKLGKDLEAVGKSMSMYVTAPIVALGYLAVEAFDKSDQAIKQMEAGLASTGNTVGLTKEKLVDMADSLEKITTYGHEEILRGVTDSLLTFNKIQGPVFEEAQKSVLDLSARFGGDLQKSAIQVGKALQDPIAGLTALKKVGVSFSETQKATIKSMVATNNIAGAQGIILKELKLEFGGSAEAAAKAGLGGFKQLQNQINVLLESFGKIIVEALNPFIEKLKGMIEGFQTLSPETKKVIVVVAALAATIGPLLVVFGAIVTMIPAFVAGFAMISGAIVPILAGITLLYGAFLILNGSMKDTNTAQTQLNKAVADGNKNAATEVGALDKLYAAATNVKGSIVDRKEATEKLQKLYPAYFKNLDDESIKNGTAKSSYDQLRDAIFNKSRAMAIDNKLQENANDRIAKEIELQDKISTARKNLANIKTNGKDETISTGTGTGATYFSSRKQQIDAANLSLKNAKTELAQFTNEAKKQDETLLNAKQEYSSKIGKLTENEQLAQKIAADSAKSDLKDVGTAAEKLKKANLEPINIAIKTSASGGSADSYDAQIAKLREFQTQVATTADQVKMAEDAIKQIDLAKALKFDPASVIVVTGGFDKLVTEMQSKAGGLQAVSMQIQDTMINLSDAISQSVTQLANNAAVGLGEAIGGLISGTETLGGVFSNMLGIVFGFMKSLGESLISLGIATIAAKKLMTNPYTAIIAGVALVALSSLLTSTLSKGPKGFADGGIVGGTSYYGDKIMARVNSGEMIANSEQQKRIFGAMSGGGAATTLIPDIRIQGQDLLVVFERAQSRKNRIG